MKPLAPRSSEIVVMKTVKQSPSLDLFKLLKIDVKQTNEQKPLFPSTDLVKPDKEKTKTQING